MYDFMENEDVYWENKTHATDLFGQRAIEIIKQQVKFEIQDRQEELSIAKASNLERI